MFTAVGFIEFFYKQSLAGMQALLTSMTYSSYSFGFYLSSMLLSLVNRITSSSPQQAMKASLPNTALQKQAMTACLTNTT
jgi:uncharacterized membrane protein YcgQ (UPF0703/DUF1980 family)